MDLGVSHLIAFVIGAFTGAAGTYLADKYTDRRREGEARNAAKIQLKSLETRMPKLIAEMRADLARDTSDLIREAVVLPHKNVLFSGSKPRFSYFGDEHPNLDEQFIHLCNAGFVVDVTPATTPIYRMTEEFVALLRM